MVWRTVHVNHAKPAKTPADGFPAPLPPPEPPQPPLGYLPRSLQRPRPRQPLPPPQPAAPTAGPTQPATTPPAATPPLSRPTTRSAANRNSASRSGQRPPAAPGRANGNSRLGQLLRGSARLTPRACAIKSHPQPASDQSRTTPKMARTYPLSLKYGTCLGHLDDLYNFSSIYLEDLHSGRRTYIHHIQHLIEALPKSGPHLALYLESPSDSPRTSAFTLLPVLSLVMALTVRWGLPQGAQRPPLLPRTPGTACGLARG